MVEAISGIDGDGDDDLYRDIVHFTERGNARLARAMLDALTPILAERGGGLFWIRMLHQCDPARSPVPCR